VRRLDEQRRSRLVTAGAPDFGNQHIEVGLDDERVRPDLRKEIGLRHHVRPVCEQNSQQIERLRRQVHFLLRQAGRASYELPRFGIEHEVAKAHLHTRLQDLGVSWLNLRTRIRRCVSLRPRGLKPALYRTTQAEPTSQYSRIVWR